MRRDETWDLLWSPVTIVVCAEGAAVVVAVALALELDSSSDESTDSIMPVL